MTYGYNATTGNLSTITAPDGGTLSYTYDGGLVKSSTWAGSVVGSINRSYDSNFRIISDNVNGASAISYSLKFPRFSGHTEKANDINNNLGGV